MRTLITGATGFAGRHLVKQLIGCGHMVLGTTRSLPNQGANAERVPLVACDFERPISADIVAAIRRFAPEQVFHLAGISNPRDCQRESERAGEINVGGTRRLLEVLAQLPEVPRVVLASSSHVYGRVAAASPFVSESSPAEPQSCYGQTKRAAERVLLEEFGGRIAGVVARAFQHAGPGQRSGFMLSDWLKQLGPSKEPIEVKTLGATVDVTDVRDVVRAYKLIAEQGRAGEIYNVGSGIARTTGELLDVLQSAVQERYGWEPRPVRETSPGRTVGPIADISRLRSSTGWEPNIPWRETVLDALEASIGSE